MKSSDPLSFSANNSAQAISGNLIIQSGPWNGGKQQAKKVNFPKKFKRYTQLSDFNRIYKKHSNISIKFRPKIGAGTNIIWIV